LIPDGYAAGTPLDGDEVTAPITTSAACSVTMGKRSKEEVEETVDRDVSESLKKKKRDKKDRSEPSMGEAEVDAETAVVEPETPSSSDQITVDDFERAKPVFKKWLSEVKNK
jgi:hypothetical protein